MTVPPDARTRAPVQIRGGQSTTNVPPPNVGSAAHTVASHNVGVPLITDGRARGHGKMFWKITIQF